MVWSAHNLSFIGSPNYAAYGSPNYAAYAAPNYAAYAAPNYAAYAAPNYAAYSAPNYAAYASPNYAAYSAPNYAAYAAPNYAAHPGSGPLQAMPAAAPTGAGGASGMGFAGGYGPVARFEYATPAALAPLPWTLDFAQGDGWPPFPFAQRINPYACQPHLEWRPGDWDPALRFWSLPFDPHLTEWLQDLNLGAPAVMAAREFAAKRHSDLWLAGAEKKEQATLWKAFEEDASILSWRHTADTKRGPSDAWQTIEAELEGLIDLMRDDRMRYLQELAVQSGQAAPFFVHLMGFDPPSKPWTMELMNCASAIGNLVKMQYKSHYKRARPSTLCPGLTPPWGPPQHPAFPSGHSTVAHLTALFLLSVPGIAQRFGIFRKPHDPANLGEQPTLAGDFQNGKTSKGYGEDQQSPLLWLAWRIARGRERLGLHYRSDSAAGRLLAALVWDSCLGERKVCKIELPTLLSVQQRAEAEWPLLAPLRGHPPPARA